MESSTTPADPVPTETAVELQDLQSSASLIPKSESVLDATDLSDTSESEAEKHGCK